MVRKGGIGVLECWSVGSAYHSRTPSLHHSIVLSRSSRGREGGFVFDEGVQVFLDLGDTQDFLDGGDAALDLVPAVDAQGAHALFHGALGDGGGGGSIEDERAKGLVEKQEFVNGKASLVSQLPAILAAGAAHEPRRGDFLLRKSNLVQV